MPARRNGSYGPYGPPRSESSGTHCLRELILSYIMMYNKVVQYEWDEAKQQSNIAKHRVSFEEVRNFDWLGSKTSPSLRRGEERYVTIGQIGNRLHVIVWLPRGDRMRIISLRKANMREVREYAQA